MVVIDAGPVVVGVGRIVGVSAVVCDVTVTAFTAAAVTLSGCVDMVDLVVDADVTVVVFVMMFLWLLLRMIFLSAWQSCY